MKRLILAALLLTTPALAQQPQYTTTTTMLLNQALECETLASGQIAALQKQIADLTKERDALKSSPKADTTPQK